MEKASAHLTFSSASEDDKEYFPPVKTAKLAPLFQHVTKRNSSHESQSSSSFIPSESPSSASTHPVPTAEQLESTQNPIWRYFIKTSDYEAECIVCNKRLQRGKSKSTSPLINHVKNKHKAEFDRYKNEKEKYSEDKKKEKQIPHQPLKTDQSQKKISQVFGKLKWDVNSKEQKKMDQLVTRFLVKGFHPYTLVEEEGFQELISEGFPRYTLPSRTTFARRIVPDLYSHEKDQLKSIILNDKENVQSFSLTTDGWKSKRGDSYLSLTCHYVIEGEGLFEMKNFALATEVMYGRQTGENIKSFLLRQADEWGISKAEKRTVPIYTVTDGGKNIVCGVKGTTWNHRECFAHKLQLVIETAVNNHPSILEMLKRARSIVGHYHKSSAARSRLLTMQKTLGSQQPKGLIQMVDTRWNSEYYMLKRLLELKIAINSELLSSPTSSSVETLNQEQWDWAIGMVEALEPFERATTIMSAEAYPTTSMVIPVLNEIETSLKDLTTGQQSVGTPKCKDFSKSLHKSLLSRFPMYRDEDVCRIATSLDPRFKCVLIDRNVLVKKLVSLALQKVEESNCKSESEKMQAGRVPENQTCKGKLWKAFSHAAETQGSYFPFNPVHSEVSSYSTCKNR